MKKLLLLIPVLALAACGQKSYTYEAFYDIEGSGKAELTLAVPGGASQSETVDLPVKNRAMLANALGRITLKVKSDNQVTCKLRVEKEKEISNSGKDTTCEYEITEDTDN
ncbi:lipoprotein [Lentzea sp. NPDC004782]|uniref:lipoprotein n=1 Tax=Lentzea sp. NPDC004782 TaxID=3154458 RepID=UPI0033B64DFB